MFPTGDNKSDCLFITESDARITEERWSTSAGRVGAGQKPRSKIHRILYLLESLSVLPGEGEVGPVCSCPLVPSVCIF